MLLCVVKVQCGTITRTIRLSYVIDALIFKALFESSAQTEYIVAATIENVDDDDITPRSDGAGLAAVRPGRR